MRVLEEISVVSLTRKWRGAEPPVGCKDFKVSAVASVSFWRVGDKDAYMRGECELFVSW